MAHPMSAIAIDVDGLEGGEEGEADDVGVDVVRFAASRVAAVVGLHEFGDPVEEFLEVFFIAVCDACALVLSRECAAVVTLLGLRCAVLQYLYQDHEELLESDAQKLDLRVLSKDAELDALVTKTGATIAPQLREILKWTADRKAPPAQLAKAQQLLSNVDALLNDPKTKRKLGKDDVEEARRMLKQKIHHSVGVRNENLALTSYEKQHGCTVRLTNENFYFLVFPHPPLVAALGSPASSSVSTAAMETHSRDVFDTLDRNVQRSVVSREREMSLDDDSDEDEAATRRQKRGYFSICGMVDGVTDTVTTISDEDDWELTPIVVEVKNRMRAFRDPPPLHDQIQMAVYMKMLDLAHGDLVQCLNTDKATIKVSRVSLSEHPLSSKSSADGDGSDLWTSVILPRLYQFTACVHKLRSKEVLRLAFLNGSAKERLEILRRDCAFL